MPEQKQTVEKDPYEAAFRRASHQQAESNRLRNVANALKNARIVPTNVSGKPT